jgi:exodeoxyribonuclease-3
MNIISWNVNGLRSILSKGFEEMLADMDPDIACLQEIRVTPDKIHELDIPGYVKIFNAATRPGYAGTAIFTKHKPISCSTELAIEAVTNTHEGRVMLLEYERFFLVNVYAPNSGAELARLQFRSQVWDGAFAYLLDGLAKTKPTIACGDFNVAHEEIDLANPSQNHSSAGFTDEERLGFSNILARGFIDVFRHQHPQEKGHYSWWSYRANARARNVGWRIDYVLASEELRPKIRESKIYAGVHGSDHAPVGATIDIEI